MEKYYYIYILASQRNGTLYIGMTSDLIKRIWEHKSKFVDSFTKKYNVNRLVYYDSENAIKREKRLKKYNRRWKLNLIEKVNPDWKDLYQEIITGLSGQAGQ